MSVFSLVRRNLPRFAGLGTALVFGQAVTYGTSLLALRLMEIPEFGLYSSLVASLGVVATLGTGFQIAIATGDSPNVSDALVQVADYARTFSIPLAGGVFLVAIPLAHSLRTSVEMSALALIASVPMFLSAGLVGVALSHLGPKDQAISVLAPPMLRFLAVVPVLVAHASLENVLFALGLGSTLAAFVVWRRFSVKHAKVHARSRSGLRGAHLRSTVSTMFLFTLSAVDVMTARWLLEARQAGVYAACALVTKIAFFLPTSVGVIAMPHMRSEERSHIRHAAYWLTAFVGMGAMLVIVPLSGAVARGLGIAGSDLKPLWLVVFAAAGVGLSLLQLAVYGERVDARAVLPLILALGTIATPVVALVAAVSSASELVSVYSVVIFAVLLGAQLARRFHWRMAGQAA